MEQWKVPEGRGRLVVGKGVSYFGQDVRVTALTGGRVMSPPDRRRSMVVDLPTGGRGGVPVIGAACRPDW